MLDPDKVQSRRSRKPLVDHTLDELLDLYPACLLLFLLRAGDAVPFSSGERFLNSSEMSKDVYFEFFGVFIHSQISINLLFMHVAIASLPYLLSICAYSDNL